MSCSHPFLTIDEQIELLIDKGMTVNDRTVARAFLISHNYYRVVNGYKDFFLDRDRSTENHDVFRAGTTFDQLMALFMFDSSLRSKCLFALETAESRMKTATVHSFCDSHRNVKDYLLPTSYRPKEQYYAKSRYDEVLRDLLKHLENASTNNCHHKSYVEHYLTTYGEVPLWVLAGCLTFGNMAHFFDLCTDSCQNKACKLIGEVTGKRVSSKKISKSYRTLRDFRNICAHGDRLFCARIGRRNSDGFEAFPTRIQPVLTNTEFQNLVVDGIASAASTLDEFPELKTEVLKVMGVETLR